MNRLIIFLIRRKLGLRKFECFRFSNQKTSDVYFFGYDALFKITGDNGVDHVRSNVSLNWLLDYDCTVIRINCPCVKKCGELYHER